MRYWLLGVLVLAAWGAHSAPSNVRLPAVAGEYYPEDPFKLQETVRQHLAGASALPSKGHTFAVVVPYAPHGLAAPVMAAAFKDIEVGQYDRVIVLAPSTSQRVRMCSVAEVEAYATPLGWVPVDTTAVQKLSFSPLIQSGTVDYEAGAEGPHEKNASIEAVLPFLQESIGLFRLVPIVVGDLLEGDPRLAYRRFDAIAESLREIIDRRTLIVVCAHFTHYGSVFGYTPFGANPGPQVRELDEELIQLVFERKGRALEETLKRTRNVMEGRSALHILMRMLPPELDAEMLAYDTTGRRTSHWENSISFAALRFSDPNLEPNESKPERQLEEKRPATPRPEPVRESEAPPTEPEAE